MSSLWRAAAVVIAAIALSGCPDRRQEPVPGPRSGIGAPHHNAPASEISWFQGTLEEAFSHRGCG